MNDSRSDSNASVTAGLRSRIFAPVAARYQVLERGARDAAMLCGGIEFEMMVGSDHNFRS